MYHLIESAFDNDNKTSYIFTSDHGMTDRGSHGDGHYHETETPIIAWGAGIKNWNHIKNLPHNQLHFHLMQKLIPRFDIEQADLTPLMASLLGIPIPVNNIGRLPHEFLNVSQKYVAAALRSNSLQLLQQYKKLYARTKQKKFKYFISDEEYKIENRVGKMEYLLKQSYKAKKYDEIPDISNTLMHVTIESIEFYQQYYKAELLFCLAITMSGWVYLLIQQLYVKDRSLYKRTWQQQLAIILVALIVLGLMLFNYVQNTPSMVTLYFLLPIITWYFVYLRKNIAHFPSTSKFKLGIATLILLVTTELMIISFFQRQYLSVVLIGHCLYELSISESSRGLNIKLLLSTIVLAVFPSLPSVGKDSKENNLLYVSCLNYILFSNLIFFSADFSKKNFFSLTLPLSFEQNSLRMDVRHTFNRIKA